MKHLIKSILLLLTLLLPATAGAYDFEVDGIYYNITSANTVEVTYKAIDISSYSDSIVIPSAVTYNSLLYSVTAIGDSAFWGAFNNNLLHVNKITIPETVTTIGKAAFKNNKESLRITCLSMTPPTMEGAFDEHEHRFPFLIFFPAEIEPSYNYPYLALFVLTDAYQNYKTENENLGFFSWIFCLDSEITAAPSYSVDYTKSFDRQTAVHVSLTPNEECDIYYYRTVMWGLDDHEDNWYGGNEVNVYSKGTCNSTFYSISCFAIAEGKLPSELISCDYGYLNAPYLMYDNYVDDSFYESGVYYTVHNQSASISGGFHKDPCGFNDWERGVDYSGNILIPNSVNDYTVTGITYQAFADCDLESLKLPNTITHIDYTAFQGSKIKKLNYPVSANCYAHFNNCSAETVYLTGDGNWRGIFPNSVKELYVGSGVTSIENMFYDDAYPSVKLNPKVIYSYATTPPICNAFSFAGYDGELHVPAASLAAYFTAPYWCNFNNIIGDAIEVTDLSLNKDSIEVLIGSQTVLNCVIAPANAIPNSISWISSDNHVATVENGVITALNKGECDIIAICQEKQVVCHLFVSSVLTNGLTLSLDSAKMEVGEHLNLIAKVLPDEDPDKRIRWSSTDGSVATVYNGTITALMCGECDIIASCCGKKAMCHIIVTNVLPIAIILSHENAEIEIGNQLTLTAIVQPENVTDKTIIWRSSNNEVATVDNSGVVTARGIGDCEIFASCGEIQAVCHINVIKKLIYITLDQHNVSIMPNHIITLTPTVTPVAADLVVTSSDPAVAAVRLAGDKIQVVGITEGTTTICVNSADGYALSDSCLVEVYTERGDVNCDGFVNISDVTVLIDALLGSDSAYSVENSDCNNDGNVTISDVTALIDALLGGATLPGKDSEIITVNGVSFKMMKVKGGTFLMGATDGQGDQAYDDEFPVHEVTLSSYSIGETEVTQALWQAIMEANPSGMTGDLNRPVETVSWNDCQTFIAKLNQMTGKSFRLPTEAEWEFAARGGNLSHDYMYAGSNDLDEVAWNISNIPSQQPNTEGYGTQPVAQKAPNELGLFDMSGNVYEWCSDWFDAYPAEAQINPTGPGDDEGCHYRVNRGGSWNRYGRSSRVSLRNNATPESAYFNIGLRLAM